MSLIQLLVGIVIGVFVTLIAVQMYFVVRDKYGTVITKMDSNSKALMLSQALRTAIDDAMVPSPHGFWPWQNKALRIPGQSFNPLLYPPIYAASSIDNFTPYNHVSGTDLLLVQGVIAHGGTTSGVSANDTTIPTTLSISDNDYVLLSDQDNHQLMRANSDSTGAQVSVLQGPSIDFATDSFVGHYQTLIFYLRQDGSQTDLFVNIDDASAGQEVIEDVDDFQVEYYMNGTWQSVQNASVSGYVNSWYKSVQAIRVKYQIENKNYSVVLVLKANSL